MHNIVFYYCKWTKFLLAVIYGSPGRHSNNTKTFKKIRKKIEYNLYDLLRLAESFKTMNRPGPTVTLFDDIFLGKYNIKIETWAITQLGNGFAFLKPVYRIELKVRRTSKYKKRTNEYNLQSKVSWWAREKCPLRRRWKTYISFWGAFGA